MKMDIRFLCNLNNCKSSKDTTNAMFILVDILERKAIIVINAKTAQVKEHHHLSNVP